VQGLQGVPDSRSDKQHGRSHEWSGGHTSCCPACICNV